MPGLLLLLAFAVVSATWGIWRVYPLAGALMAALFSFSLFAVAMWLRPINRTD
jgi:hypothetical protein